MRLIMTIGCVIAVSGSAIATDLVSAVSRPAYRPPAEIASDEYALDDGVAEILVGAGDFRMIWLNQFNVVAGFETITAIRIAWGFGAEGVSGQALIFDDPNNDGDPTDITTSDLLASVPISGGPRSDAFLTYPVANVFVGNAGDSFFVGVCMLGATNPAGLDQTNPDHARSWTNNGHPSLFACDNPNVAPGGPLHRIDSLGPSWAGDWMVRANALGTVAVETCGWGMIKARYK